MKEEVERLNQKIDNLESMIRLLLANTLLDDSTNIEITDTSIDTNISIPHEVSEYLFENGFGIHSMQMYMNCIILNISVMDKINQLCGDMAISGFWSTFFKINFDDSPFAETLIQDISDMYNFLINNYKDIIPVFCFDSIGMNSKDKLMRKSISFHVQDKELHIFR